AHDESHYDLNLIIVPGRQLQFRVSFNANAYPASWIERIVGHLLAALGEGSRDLERTIAGIDILASDEREQLLAFEQAPRDIAATTLPPVVELLRQRPQASPHALAVRSHDGTLTYAALDALSDRL